jgi:acylpyruvate hydrolase
MRLATVRIDAGTQAARVEDEELALLPFEDVGAALAAGVDLDSTGADGRITLASADLAPVVTRPEKIFCVGLNYAAHAKEAGLEVPSYPPLFAKFARSLIGPNDDLVLPENSDKVDWEVELGVVIGRATRHVTAEEALSYVGGYTVVNDVSMRDWQRRTSQFLQGKTFESSSPVGPWLVTPDEIPDPQELTLRCKVDGEVMQETSTSDMVFSVAELVSYISAIITLVPGDLIATGTPSGVGGARRPQVFLTDGSVMVSEIDGLGAMCNPCRAAVAGDTTAAVAGQSVS